MSKPTQSEVLQVRSDQQTTLVVGDAGEQQYVVEFEERVDDYSPPKIVQPLQPIAVTEGLSFYQL